MDKNEPTKIKLVRLEERQIAIEKAIILQAAEYARRLDVLNHAHEKAERIQNTYVTHDKFEDNQRAAQTARDVISNRMELRIEKLDKAQDEFITQDLYNERHIALQNRLNSVELWRSNIQGRFVVLAMFAGVFIAAFTAIITKAVS